MLNLYLVAQQLVWLGQPLAALQVWRVARARARAQVAAVAAAVAL